MLRAHGVTGSSRCPRSTAAGGGVAPLPGLLRLQRTAGNAAVARLLAGPAAGAAAGSGAIRRPGADPTPLAVQRTALRIEDRLVPGTDSEDAETLRAHLRNASWRDIAEVLWRGTREAATNPALSDWDRHVGAEVAAQVARARHESLIRESGGKVPNHSSKFERAQHQRAMFLLGRLGPGGVPGSPLPAVPAVSTPTKRPLSPSPDPAKKRRVEVAVSASIVPARTSSSMLDLTNAEAPNHPYIWRMIVLDLPYEDLPNLMLAAKGLWQVVADEFRTRVANLMALDPLLHAVIRCVARYSPTGSIGAERGGRLVLPAEVNPTLLQEVTRAVGWRGYSSALRRQGGLVGVTLRAFVTEVLEHTELTRVLREQASYPERDKSAYVKFPKLTERFKELEQQLAKHWLSVAEHVPPAEKTSTGGRKVPPGQADQEAKDLANAIGATSSGHNIAIEHHDGKKLVYSNRTLEPHQRKVIEDHGFVLVDGTTEERSDWGGEHGVGRGRYDMPFHAEMQRSDDRPPWQFGYAGNIYFACVQCMAAYHALGIAPGPEGYLGTHASKAPSIIPPAVRTMSVYLQHYLGTTVWEHVSRTIRAFIRATSPDAMDLDELVAIRERLADIFQMLDEVERANTDIYRQLGLNDAPSQTFGPKFNS